MKNRPLPVDFSQKCVTFAINLRTQTEMADYEIFISCKSEDYEIAESVDSDLVNKGCRVLVSAKELRRGGEADYIDGIS